MRLAKPPDKAISERLFTTSGRACSIGRNDITSKRGGANVGLEFFDAPTSAKSEISNDQKER